jgi:hypothetical protein
MNSQTVRAAEKPPRLMCRLADLHRKAKAAHALKRKERYKYDLWGDENNIYVKNHSNFY